MVMVVDEVQDNKDLWAREIKEFFKHRHNLSFISDVLMCNNRL